MASLIYGADVMILLPFADLYDLEVFFREGCKVTESTDYAEEIYNFNVEFWDLTDGKLQDGIKREAFGLAEALRWLHNELRLYREHPHYMAHMDVKPENILIFRDQGSPIGKFKLSDFGVSWFKEAVEEINGKLYSDSPRNIQKQRHHRACGTYQPPEINEGESPAPETDGRKCDVWSFGCLLTELLAFAIGRKDLLQHLRTERSMGRDDYFYQTRSPNGMLTFEVKSCIRKWLGDLQKQKNRPSWLLSYVKLVEEILKPNPMHRPTMKAISNRLRILDIPETSNNPLPNDTISKTVVPTVDEDSSSESHATHSNSNSNSNHTTMSGGTPPSIPTTLTLSQTSSCKLSEEGKILALETTARGDELAVLFKQSFVICKFDGAKLFKLSSKRLDQSVEWRKIKIGKCYVAVYGLCHGPSPYKVVSEIPRKTGLAKKIQVRIFAFQRNPDDQSAKSPWSSGDHGISELQKASKEERLVFDVALSETGLAAYCFETCILLRDLK